MPPVRVVVADEQPLVRDALALAFADGPDFLMLGCGAGTADAVALVRAHAPEVVVLGLGLGQARALSVLGALRGALTSVRVVVVTADEDPRLPLLALERGAGGCLTKRATIVELRGAVRAVSAGCVVLDARSVDALVRIAGTRDLRRRVLSTPRGEPSWKI